MTTGQIQRIPCQRVEPRHDARLPAAWIGGPPTRPAVADGAWLNRRPDPTAPSAAGTALALLGAQSDDTRSALLAQAAAGARAYALVGPTWGKDPGDLHLLHAPRVLVRRVPEVPATALLSGGSARLWIGGGLALRLDATQAEALRQTFLRLFWHEATEEAFAGGPAPSWRPARDRPFDVPELTASAVLRREAPDARLGYELRGSLLHLASGAPPELAPQRLWLAAGPSHHDRLTRLVQAGAEVVWSDRGLPDMVVSGGAGELLLPGSRARLRVRLNPDQTAEAARLLEAPAEWRFQTQLRLGDDSLRAARLWLAGEPTARGLEPEQQIDLPEIFAPSLRGAPGAVPAALPAAQPLALAVRYRWTVMPPRAPAGAEEDALVGRWRALDADWTGRLTRAREALTAAEVERGRIGRAFSRLANALLGFERTHSGLRARLGALEAARPSAAGPLDTPALLTQLEELENDVRTLKGDLEHAEHKAREDEEREKQQAAWQRDLDGARHELPGRRATLEAAERRRAALGQELKAVDEALPTADKDASKDLRAQQRKLSDELERTNAELKRVAGEITALELRSAARFVFTPPAAPAARTAAPGARFVPATPGARTTATIPEDALPEVGVLRSHQGKRYLIVHDWAQLDRGERDAARLHARLVAPEST